MSDDSAARLVLRREALAAGRSDDELARPTSKVRHLLLVRVRVQV